MNPKTDSIPKVEKQYKDEWLLFEVYETNELDQPIKGRLISHSPYRDEIHKVAMENKSLNGYIVFTGNPVEHGRIPIL